MLRGPRIFTLFPYTTLFRSCASAFWALLPVIARDQLGLGAGGYGLLRSEEHTSELQSRRDLVCRLLLEKKNINVKDLQYHYINDPSPRGYFLQVSRQYLATG